MKRKTPVFSETFRQRVREGMRAKGIGLRDFCRQVNLDPSFFSKVLSGKRSPPSEEQVLRRMSEVLELDPLELILSAGRIPAELSSQVARPGFSSQLRVWLSRPPLATKARGESDSVQRRAAPPQDFRRDLAEELL
ncbi:MAG: helix-turn-helix transcriptional regulator [Elusimicrobia bacterium]|nr:helix-turn-helix transcriptional regulator [Elusimicrobiota bacterium]